MKQNRQNEMLTELVLILDRSGSMHGLEADTIGGFRTMIEKQKAQPGEALVTTVLFNHELRRVHDRLALAQVPPITPAEYEAFGSTALMDAIGTTVEHIANIHRYARPEDVPAHTIFAIITDGMENCSTRSPSSCGIAASGDKGLYSSSSIPRQRARKAAITSGVQRKRSAGISVMTKDFIRYLGSAVTLPPALPLGQRSSS